MKTILLLIGTICLCGAETPKAGPAFIMLALICFGVAVYMDRPKEKQNELENRNNGQLN